MNSNGQTLDVVKKFCYIGDTIGARGGAEDSITGRIRSGWSKFRELVPLLASKGLSLASKGRLYQACVRSVMLYASETWPLKEEDLARLERNDASMVRWMCRVQLNEHIPSSRDRNKKITSGGQNVRRFPTFAGHKIIFIGRKCNKGNKY